MYFCVLQDPEAFRILSTTPRNWSYTDEKTATDLTASSCPIRLAKPGGKVVSVSHNNRSAAPLSSLAADQVASFYGAMRSFHRLLTSDEFELKIRLNAGDVLVFANNRVWAPNSRLLMLSTRAMSWLPLTSHRVLGARSFMAGLAGAWPATVG